jgi:hypothetical protein
MNESVIEIAQNTIQEFDAMSANGVIDDTEKRELACAVLEMMRHINNLETLVLRLHRYIDKCTDGDSKLADQAIDYIRRKSIGVHSSILRDTGQ